MPDPLGRPRRAAALALGLLLIPVEAPAQEWDEAYRSGVAALARGDHARAAQALRRAIAQRPEPGRNVPTYGTNIEPRYFPYLRLAEACLALGQLEAAREALEKSASWGSREPPDERQRLSARLEAALAPRSVSPAPAPAPTATAVPPTAPPVTTAPAPTPVPAPAIPPALKSPRPAMPEPLESLRPGAAGAQGPRPRAQPSGGPPGSPAPPTAAAGTLEVISQPAGATAYIDDEPVGATDPQSGRLVKTGLAPGHHRVRVARAGHEDAVRDIDIARGGYATFYATLTPVPAVSAGARAGFVAFALLAIGLVGVFAWIALRRPEGAELVPHSASRSAPLASAGTPPEQMNPGVTSDEAGQEWFGDYRLLEMLGRGGMASVFKAERRGELSALKRPLARLLDDPQFRQRFLREAEIGRTLNHPNIVRILERGNVRGVPYFTMELLPGETLQAFVGRGRAAPRAAAAIVVQVAEALDLAHGKGVVHRDLKPSNVMLLPDGTAKVMDFGLARARRFEGLTATEAFVGTPNYVAPETIEGRGTDARSDLYALGLILFELLTGRTPFSGETPYAILKKHCTEEPPAPSGLQPGIPAELEAMVLRLLRKDPGQRPASAEELVVALREWLTRAV